MLTRYGSLEVIVGGQFGSEGKGALAYSLARGTALGLPVVSNLCCCRVGGPNAGHTAIDETGREWKFQQVPVGALVHRAELFIGPGSVVDPDILARELAALDEAGYLASKRLLVDPEATVLYSWHAEEERGGKPHGLAGLTRRIGSTGKGVGIARSERVLRTGLRVKDDLSAFDGIRIGDTVEPQLRALHQGGKVQVEGTQGFGLGLHAGYYPFATSADCRAIDVLGQAGISPWSPEIGDFRVWVVFRTFPIRVAGNSGPLLRETTWDDINQEPEITTVTRKERRVGEWDSELAYRAVVANGGAGRYGRSGPVRIALLFLDYVFPELAGCLDRDHIVEVAEQYLANREIELGQPIDLVGVGPSQIVRLGSVARV